LQVVSGTTGAPLADAVVFFYDRNLILKKVKKILKIS
jgi:hypothetical protein